MSPPRQNISGPPPAVRQAALTPVQRQAVEARGNVLVVAGAGTGKTFTVVERAISILLDENASIENILMVTFTEAAAAEMRHRIRLALLECQRAQPESEHVARQLALLDAARISTLHSFCLALVREHFQELALDPQVTVLDDAQTRPLVEETFEALFAAAYADASGAAAAEVRDLLRRYGGGSEERVRRLVRQLHRYSQGLPDPAAWFRDQHALFAEETPRRWRDWFTAGFADWRRLWRPALQTGAGQVPNIVRCAAALDATGDTPAFESAAAALLEITAAFEADWERGTVKTFRDPIKAFFKDAVFLSSLTARDGETDPLAQDWDWVRHPMSALLRLAQEFGVRFGQAKRDLGGVDFADLEQLALRLLWEAGTRVPTPLARQLRQRFQHVFVDECQDINEAQDAILRAVGGQGEAANRFLVGDVKQSIYRFRLARPDIFRAYEEDWRDHPAAGRRIPLADNFRSREAILSCVNHLFAALMRPAVGGVAYDADAQLRFGDRENRLALAAGNAEAAQPPEPRSPAGETHNPEGGVTRRPDSGAAGEECGSHSSNLRDARVALHLITREGGQEDTPDGEEASGQREELADLQSTEREARLVACLLRDLKAAGHRVWDAAARQFRPAEWDDMVVLLRSPANRAETYAKEFSRARVPLQAARGGFYKTAEILDLLSLLQILDNPLQDVPLLAVLRSPLVGLSLAELAEIRLAVRRERFWTSLRRWHQARPLEARGAGDLWSKVDAFLGQFARWRRLAREGSLSECLEAALAGTHYEAFLQAGPRGAERVANVRLLLARARQFDPCQRQGLFRFLRFVAAQQEAEVEEEPAPLPTGHAVRLMSIHKSKGLEFPVVVLAGLGSQFNFGDLRSDILLSNRYGLGAKVIPPGTEQRYPSLAHWLAARTEQRELLGEEMRLLYVAMTRARDTLLLVGSAPDKEAGQPWPTGASLPIPDLEILQARCPLDWLRLWLPTATGEEDWTSDAAGGNALLGWNLYAQDHSGLRTDSKNTAFPQEPVREPEPEPAQVASLRDVLFREYGFHAATVEPAKTSVTTLRRRATDAEESFRLDFGLRGSGAEARRPTRPATGLSAAERGTAHHLFQQMVSLDEAGSELGLRNEAQKLVAAGQLSPAQAEALDFQGLLGFWQSELGCRIRAQDRRTVHREMPFTLRASLADLAALGIPRAAGGCSGAAADEFVVVQGTVDLAIVRDQDIWLVDFKSDKATPTALDEKARLYTPQLRLYALALERICQRPVTERWLYFLMAHRSVQV